MSVHHRMTNPQMKAEATGSTQRDMAISLLHELGYELAVTACCTHGWKDTLGELSELVDDEVAPKN